MRLNVKSEWFVLDKPFGEPEEKWPHKHDYYIQRIVDDKDKIVWTGINCSWEKESGKAWKKHNKHTHSFNECERPIYEDMYIKSFLFNKERIKIDLSEYSFSEKKTILKILLDLYE